MKNMKKILALALVVMSVLAISIPALAETTNYVKVQGPGYTVNIRNASGSKIGAITHGSAVYVLGTSGTRKQIRCHDASTGKDYGVSSNAYIEAEFLSSTIPADTLWITRYGTVDHKYTDRRKQGCEELQHDLNIALGLSLTEDGICGTNTVNAIRSFQSQNGLTNDGIAGNRTKEYLYKLTH